MNAGPTSNPRGERAGTPGVRAVTELQWAEVVVDDDRGESPFGWSDPEPRPNRATRRAAARATRRAK